MKKIMTTAGLVLTLIACQSQAQADITSSASSADGMQPLTLVSSHQQDFHYLTNAFESSLYRLDDSIRSVQRVNLTVTADIISGRGIGMQMFEKIALQNKWSDMDLLEDRLSTLVKMLDRKLIKGDSIIIEYSPQRGSQILVNNDFMGILPGADLFQAIVASWQLDISEQPRDTSIAQSTDATVSAAES